MMLAHPTALVWGLLAIPVVVLYLRKVRARRQATATAFLWEKVVSADEPRSRWRRWRHPVSLVVQLAILVLVVVAMAEPQWRAPRRVMLVVDNSASMNAVDVKPNRLAEARRRAREQIAALGDRDQMAIVCTTGPGVLNCAWTSRKDLLRDAVQEIPPTQGPTQIGEALALARHVLAGDPNGHIVVVTDGAVGPREDAADLTPGAKERSKSKSGAASERWILVAGAGRNAAITRLAPRRCWNDPRSCQVLVEVTNFHAALCEGRLHLEWNGQVLDRIAVRLPANGAWRQTYQFESPQGGQLCARLEPADDLVTDNQAVAAVPPPRIHLVAVADGAGRSVRQALAANPRVEQVGDDRTQAGKTGPPIRVFCGEAPRRLPTGPLMIFDPASPCELWDLGGPIDDATIARQASDTPFSSDVRLEGLQLSGARRLRLRTEQGTTVRQLLWTADGTPLAFAIERPQGRAFVLLGRLEAGELTHRTAWPVLLADALDWVDGIARDRGEADDLPRDARESDLRASSWLTEAEWAKPAADGPARTPLWIYLTAAALAAFVAEWCLYHRRWTC